MAQKIMQQKGEDAAARFLVHRGYEVLERDFETKLGTCPIIAKQDNVLVFVSVNTRSRKQGFGEESSMFSRKQFEEIALDYVSEHDMCEMVVRFDEITVVVRAEDRALIKHFINALADAA